MIELTSHSKEELKLLRQMTQLSKGAFSISICICNHPVVVEEITTLLEVEHEACPVRLDSETQQVLSEIKKQVGELENNCESIAVIGLNELMQEAQWQEKGETILYQINRTRDAWKEELPAIPVMLWVNDFVYRMLASKAHDFWSWVSHLFEFEARPDLSQLKLQEIQHLSYSDGSNLSSDEKQERIAELQHRIESLPESPSIQVENTYHYWSIELTDLFISTGQLNKALKLAQSLIPTIQNPKILALTQGKIADILQSRGKLDEAMEIRKTKELPVYEKLGDVGAVAVTQGKIADILKSRGTLDEAMEIRKTKELPVYEKLGDVRSLAVTQGKIADILQSRGKLDEAMEIRMTKQLPVFEKLGDARSLAVVKAKIALIYLAKKQLDPASQLMREAYQLAKGMKIREAEQIAEIAEQVGISLDQH